MTPALTCAQRLCVIHYSTFPTLLILTSPLTSAQWLACLSSGSSLPLHKNPFFCSTSSAPQYTAQFLLQVALRPTYSTPSAHIAMLLRRNWCCGESGVRGGQLYPARGEGSGPGPGTRLQAAECGVDRPAFGSREVQGGREVGAALLLFSGFDCVSRYW